MSIAFFNIIVEKIVVVAMSKTKKLAINVSLSGKDLEKFQLMQKQTRIENDAELMRVAMRYFFDYKYIIDIDKLIEKYELKKEIDDILAMNEK